MDGWNIALGLFAGFLAIKILLTLMKSHEQKVRREVAIAAANARVHPAVAPAEPPATRS